MGNRSVDYTMKKVVADGVGDIWIVLAALIQRAMVNNRLSDVVLAIKSALDKPHLKVV